MFYPSLYGDIIQYNFIVNLGLILGFLASLFMAVMLSQGKTKLHTSIECIWGAIYIIAAYQFSSLYAIWGLALVTLIMNAIKMIIVLLSLFFSLKTENE